MYIMHMFLFQMICIISNGNKEQGSAEINTSLGPVK